MNRRQGNLPSRLEKLERVSPTKGAQFFMIWGKSDGELAAAIERAKANGDVQVGDKFSARIWTHPTEPRAPRWVTVAEMERDELIIFAGGEEEDQAPLSHSERNALNRMTNAELSTCIANGLPSVV
jgi:hypothetical protein